MALPSANKTPVQLLQEAADRAAQVRQAAKDATAQAFQVEPAQTPPPGPAASAAKRP